MFSTYETCKTQFKMFFCEINFCIDSFQQNSAEYNMNVRYQEDLPVSARYVQSKNFPVEDGSRRNLCLRAIRDVRFRRIPFARSSLNSLSDSTFVNSITNDGSR